MITLTTIGAINSFPKQSLYKIVMGGMATDVPDIATFSSRSGIPLIDLLGFEIVGEDVICYTASLYSCAVLYNSSLAANQTYMYDEAMQDVLGYYNFRNYTAGTPPSSVPFNWGLKIVELPNVIALGGRYTFQHSFIERFIFPNCLSFGSTVYELTWNGNFMAKVLYFPRCTQFSITNSGDEKTHQGITPNAVLYLNPFLATCNGGGEEADVAQFRAKGHDIRYVTDFTAPSAITDLIEVEVLEDSAKYSWSTPASVNGIDFYDVYINGNHYDLTYRNNINIVGLTNGETYTITVRAVDMFYNRSPFSNSVVTTVNGSGKWWTPNILAYFKFNDDIIDSVGLITGTLNGTPTWVSMVNGNGLKFQSGCNINTNQKALISGRSQFTVFYRHSMGSNGANNYHFSSWGAAANDKGVRIYTNYSSYRFYISIGEVIYGGIFPAGESAVTGNLRLFTVTYDGEYLRAYNNGYEYPTKFACSGVIDTPVTETERFGYSGTSAFDDFMFFDRALDYNEIKELNKITQTAELPLEDLSQGLVLYQRFNNDVADATGNHTPVPTGITYENGLYSGTALEASKFGTSKWILIPDSNLLSFGDGVNDFPFSVSFVVKFSTLGSADVATYTKMIIQKRGATHKEWQVMSSNSAGSPTISLALFDESSGGQIRGNGSTILVNGVVYHVIITYDGSKTVGGIKITLNGVEETVVDGGSVGGYVAMENGTSHVAIGTAGWSLNRYNFKGNLDGLGVWNKELPPHQKTIVYNKQLSGLELI